MPVPLKRSLRALLPGATVLLLASAAVWRLDDASLGLVTGRYAYVLYAAGVVLSGLFHRSRVAIALLGLATLEIVASAAGPEGAPLVVFGTCLLPLFGGLSLSRDRGVLSRGGLLQVAGAAALSGGWYLFLRDPANIASFSGALLLPPELIGETGIPQATLAVAAASLLAAVYGALRWRSPVELALLWSQVVLLLALHPRVGLAEASILLMAAGLILSISVLETSYVMAFRDELTGLPARRALLHDLDQIGGRYTVAMVDVDHFKKFNDKYGHDVGDQVLHLVASRLASGPGGGRAYRYGGEEFTLVYPGRLKADALPHMEAVRASVEEASFSLRAWNRPRRKPAEPGSNTKRAKRARKLSVTVSAGVADSSEKGATPESVLKQADKALYRAKRAGRNRVSK